MKIDVEFLRHLFSSFILRKERDSNPRYSCPYTAFRVRPDRPLRHLSFQKRCKDRYFFVKLYRFGAKKCKKENILHLRAEYQYVIRKQQILFNRCLDQTSRYDCTRHHHKHTDNIGHSRKVAHHKQRSRGHHTPKTDTTDLLWIHFATITLRQRIDKIWTKSNQNRTRNNYRHSN